MIDQKITELKEECMSELRSALNYTIDRKPRGDPVPPVIKGILGGQLFYHQAVFRAAPSITVKVDF